jgi:hypothetical protein
MKSYGSSHRAALFRGLSALVMHKLHRRAFVALCAERKRWLPCEIATTCLGVSVNTRSGPAINLGRRPYAKSSLLYLLHLGGFLGF